MQLRYFALLAIFITIFGACKTTSEATADSDCGKGKVVSSGGTIHSTGDFFSMQTPEARNDCEAHYTFLFRWADPLRRVAEQPGHEEMPPIDNMAHIFFPSGEFAYFPHPNPILSDVSFGGGPDEKWWVISFDIGNKNTEFATTAYAVECRLDPKQAGSADDTEIKCSITYYDKPAK